MARASKINHHPLMSASASLFGPAHSNSDSNGQDSLLPLDDKKKRIDPFLSWKCVSGGGGGVVARLPDSPAFTHFALGFFRTSAPTSLP